MAQCIDAIVQRVRSLFCCRSSDEVDPDLSNDAVGEKAPLLGPQPEEEVNVRRTACACAENTVPEYQYNEDVDGYPAIVRRICLSMQECNATVDDSSDTVTGEPSSEELAGLRSDSEAIEESLNIADGLLAAAEHIPVSVEPILPILEELQGILHDASQSQGLSRNRTDAISDYLGMVDVFLGSLEMWLGSVAALHALAEDVLAKAKKA